MAYYAPGPDVIQLPVPQAFRDGESYAATKVHELAHWGPSSPRGWGWVFIEAKLASKTDTYKTDRIEEWIDRYSVPCQGLLNEVANRKVQRARFPQQLLRNIAFDHRMREHTEHAIVVALVSESDKTEIASWVAQCLISDGPLQFGRATWEAQYRALPVDLSVKPLRDYFESKSVGLRPAFAIGPPVPGTRASAGATV